MDHPFWFQVAAGTINLSMDQAEIAHTAIQNDLAARGFAIRECDFVPDAYVTFFLDWETDVGATATVLARVCRANGHEHLSCFDTKTYEM